MRLLLLFCFLFAATSIFGQKGKTTLVPRKTTTVKEAQLSYDEGTYLFDNGHYKSAMLYYQDAYLMDTFFVEALDGLGKCYQRMSMPDSALHFFKKSYNLFPKGPSALEHLALLYEYKNDHKNALKFYEELSKASPNKPEGFYGAARMNILLGEYRLSVRQATKALELAQARKVTWIGETLLLLAVGHTCINQRDKAKEFAIRAVGAGIVLDKEQKELFGMQ